MKRTNEVSKNAKRQKSGAENIEEGQLGIIDSINLVNFMCHDNLSFKFGPHMNFIIGQNGSGKSAILNALILAFGARSATTGRATNIKNFIKNGKQKAKIEIILRNRGESAYKPDEYGEKVIVVREITISGSSSYKIKSENGAIISTQKLDLMNLLEAMDIQVDNPVSILTQENSKKFLLSKDAKEERLYECFYKGTGLEFLNTKYSEIKARVDDTKLELEKKEQLLPSLQKEVNRLKKLLDGRKRIQQLREELLWAIVIAVEKMVKEAENELTKSQKDAEKVKRESEKCKTQAASMSGKLAECDGDKKEVHATLAELAENHARLREEEKQKADALHERKFAFERCKREVQTLKDTIASYENSIREQQQKDRRDVQALAQERARKAESLRLESGRISERVTQLTQRRDQARERMEQVQQQMEQLRPQVNQHQFAKENLERDLRRTQEALKDQVNVFGERTEAVLREIRNRRSAFRREPVGPVGLFLKVRDEQWSGAVEECISGKLLRSFCADNQEDSRVLRDILRRHYPRDPPTIIVCQFASVQHDVSQHKARSNHPTVLDMLNISNIVAANCLIDQCGIESVLLLPDPDEATDLMLNRPPANCRGGYLPNCDQICLRPYRYYSSRSRRGRSLLNVPAQEDVRYLREQLKVESDSLAKCKEDEMSLRRDRGTLEQQVRSMEAEHLKLSSLHASLEDRAAEMERVEEEDTVDTHCLEEELAQLRLELPQKEEQAAELRRDYQQRTQELAQMRQDLKTVRDQTRECKEKIEEKNNQMAALTKEREWLEGKRRDCEASLKESKAEQKRLQEKVRKNEEALQTNVSNAESACARIETTRSPDEIKVQMEQLDKILLEENRNDEERLLQQYNEKRTALKETRDGLKRLTQQSEREHRMLSARLSKFRFIVKHTEMEVNAMFITVLEGNSYRGKLHFNMEQKRLHIEVNPHSGSGAQGAKHGSLSGGERSFVTVAFLIALWESTKMPFKILDEYDVFMDDTNRQLSLDLLCGRAKQMPRTQFLFLSPLDLPRMEMPAPLLQVHRLEPPKRMGLGQ